MVTLSKSLSATQARAYHAEEFGNARENYYTAADQIRGQWHGRLAERWGLTGEVRDEHFARLAEGQHPLTGEALVRHRIACRYTNERGQTVTTMAHRAGWDATFSARTSNSNSGTAPGRRRLPRIRPARKVNRSSRNRSTIKASAIRTTSGNHVVPSRSPW
jgi:conjugative relaxase-like TrwC/TraI family protein